MTYVITLLDTRGWLQIFTASLVLSLLAQLSFPLPFSCVPVTAQTFVVTLIGGILGAKRGAFAVAMYLFYALLGLPVLAGGGGGIFSFFGPTGGYLIGFVLQAYLVGLFAYRSTPLFIASSLMPLLLGAAWLSLFIGVKSAFFMGVTPFLYSEIAKTAAAAIFLKGCKRFSSTAT